MLRYLNVFFYNYKEIIFLTLLLKMSMLAYVYVSLPFLAMKQRRFEIWKLMLVADGLSSSEKQHR